MARSNAAHKRPPEKELPSAPAGAHGPQDFGSNPYDDVSELLGVAVDFERRRGRGAQSNAAGRYEPMARVAFDDGWRSLEDLPPFKTTVAIDATRKIITRNDSPDIGFDRSINPYRGCEHGCVYCFARPTHAYLGLSPGLDFESKLLVKPEAADLLERELSAPSYQPKVIAIGTNTDPYQPVERRYQVMRRVLEVLDRANHPVGIVTKSALVLRDLDILARMAERNLAKVALVGDHARRRPRPHHGAARGDADAAAGGAAPPVGCRRADHGDGGAGDPRAQRHGDRAHSRFRRRRRRQGSRLRAAAAAARSARSCSANGSRRTIRTARSTCSSSSATCAAARTTTRRGASA